MDCIKQSSNIGTLCKSSDHLDGEKRHATLSCHRLRYECLARPYIQSNVEINTEEKRGIPQNRKEQGHAPVFIHSPGGPYSSTPVRLGLI